MLQSQNLKQRNNYEHRGKISANKFIKLEHEDGSISQKEIYEFRDNNDEDELKNDVVAVDNAQHVLESDSGTQVRHLVKTVADLPVFVSIEGYHIASYKINGESHLCLPQLLLNIKQKFNLEKVVNIFEEIIINFPSASPKQVEGFIKASVLPPDAKSCPLIKRSDAERVCLKLFDQLTQENGNTGGAINLCSNVIRNKSDLFDGSDEKLQGKVEKRSSPSLETCSSKCSTLEIEGKKSAASSLNDDQLSQDSGRLSGESQHDKEHDQTSCNRLSEQQNSQSSSKLNNTKVDDRFLFSTNNDSQAGRHKRSGDKCLERISKLGETSSNNSDRNPKLFECETQVDILNLARDATSTLIIQVYHKCFGKCNGFYYPSLLIDYNSKCIECAHCHIFLSPRRFIGHVDGVREVNVCHWGFNSYNWRHYIRLSKKQSMNNLDEDELLMKFEQLRSIEEPIGTEAHDDDFFPIKNDTQVVEKKIATTNQCRSKLDQRRISSVGSEFVPHMMSPTTKQTTTNDNKRDKQTSKNLSSLSKCADSIDRKQHSRQQQIEATSKPLPRHTHNHNHHNQYYNHKNLCAQNTPVSQAQTINYPNQLENKLNIARENRAGLDLGYPKISDSIGQSSRSSTAFNQTNINIAHPSELLIPPQLLSPPTSSISSAASALAALAAFDNQIQYNITHRDAAADASTATTTNCFNYPGISSAPTMLHNHSDLMRLPLNHQIHHNIHNLNNNRKQLESNGNSNIVINSPPTPSSSASTSSSYNSDHNQFERNLQRDVFVSTNLATYLSARKIDPQTTEDIITCTLGLINKSRTLF